MRPKTTTSFSDAWILSLFRRTGDERVTASRPAAAPCAGERRKAGGQGQMRRVGPRQHPMEGHPDRGRNRPARVEPGAVEAIKTLDQRGILHSIASKNNPESALAALDHFGLREYFLAPQISWGPKSAAITEIARRLNIHKNTFLFIDDQPFETGRSDCPSHPDVRVAPETEIGDLLGCPNWPRRRPTRRGIVARCIRSRKNARRLSRTPTPRSSSFCAPARSVSPSATSRAPTSTGSLSFRNEPTSSITRARRRRGRMSKTSFRAPRPGKAGLVLACSDKFGDYGVIGFAIVDTERFHVENFFMSCRVQHKKVDHAFFAWLITQAMRHGRDTVSTVFHFSGRNQSARQVLEEMAFAPSETDEVYVSPRLRGFAGARPRDGDRRDDVGARRDAAPPRQE